jgi:hypothetical protein
MITATESLPVETSSNSSKTFNIKATSKSFKILSSGIYSDQIAAPIRELGTNAYDSHVAAGKQDVPFVVHAPTPLEPWFSVRDFGIGMSNEKIETLYVTYFDSDKTDSNDFIGGLGLGSKSPFCYTDSFTITSWINNRKTIYNCFLNSNGLPSISKMFETDSNEPTGIEIKFSVKSNDFSNFIQKIQQVYNVFVNRPTIEGTRISFSQKEYEFKREFWALLKRDSVYCYQQRGLVAVMGNIRYPIDGTIIQQHNKSIKQISDDTIYAICSHNHIEIFFNIGELEIAASREALQYDEKTINAIINKLILIQKEVKDDFVEKTKNIKSEYDAHLQFHNILSSETLYTRILSQRGFDFNNKTILSPFFRLEQYINNGEIKSVLMAKQHYRKSKIKITHKEHQLLCSNDSEFFINDLDNDNLDSSFKAIKRIRFYLKSKIEQDENAYINKHIYLINSTNVADISKKLEDKGFTLKNVSSLPKPVYKRTINKEKIKDFETELYIVSPERFPHFSRIKLSDKIKYYYFFVKERQVISNNNPSMTHNLYEMSEISKIFSASVLSKMKLDEYQIVGIPHHRRNTFNKLKNFHNMFDEINKFCNFKNTKFINYYLFHEIFSKGYTIEKKVKDLIVSCNKHNLNIEQTDFCKIQKMFKTGFDLTDYEKIFIKYNNIIFDSELKDIYTKFINSVKIDVNKIAHSIKQKYPLVYYTFFITNRYNEPIISNSECVMDFREYINMKNLKFSSKNEIQLT